MQTEQIKRQNQQLPSGSDVQGNLNVEGNLEITGDLNVSGNLIVHGDLVIKEARITQGQDPVKTEQSKESKAAILRRGIDEVMPFFKNKRHWFGVCKAIMEGGLVSNGDFEGAARLIRQAYPEGMKFDIDVRDLVSMNSGCMTKPISEWEEASSGLGKAFAAYLTIATALRIFLKVQFKD
ncbi:MAG: hypothetical protein MJZ73_02325 [Bacteroidaceae bacterium]|nr:hypothetical protein [Bacteroidaceae bacterium]